MKYDLEDVAYYVHNSVWEPLMGYSLISVAPSISYSMNDSVMSYVNYFIQYSVWNIVKECIREKVNELK